MKPRLDIVIFGATGFTGKYVVKEMVRLVQNGLAATWGIAGRSESKLLNIVNNLTDETGYNFSSVPKIFADVNDENSINEMCKRAKVIVNCCGPFILYGENIVRGCIQHGTHYVDITGEPLFMEIMFVKYNKMAEEANVYVISSCGYDSIPADLGVVFFDKKFNGIVNDVELYISMETENMKSIINYATWESLIYGISNAENLKKMRKVIFKNKRPFLEPPLEKRSIIHKNKEIDGWFLPFPGSDRSVIKRSQNHFYEEKNARPIQIESYIGHNSLTRVFGTMFTFLVAMVLCKSRIGQRLLLKYPQIFTFGFITNNNPSENTMEKSASIMRLIGHGWNRDENIAKIPPTRKMNVQISCKNPCYGATCTMVLLSALTLITESNKISKRGGVLTPAFAFSETSLIEQLQQNGISFEVTSEESIIKSKL